MGIGFRGDVGRDIHPGVRLTNNDESRQQCIFLLIRFGDHA